MPIKTVEARQGDTTETHRVSRTLIISTVVAFIAMGYLSSFYQLT